MNITEILLMAQRYMEWGDSKALFWVKKAGKECLTWKNQFGCGIEWDAARFGCIDVLAYLLDMGVDLTAPIVSVHAGRQLKTLTFLEQHDLLDVNAKCEHGMTPLHVACSMLPDDFQKQTVIERQKSTIRFLLERGADPKAVNDDGETPLDRATQSNITEWISLFEYIKH